MNQLIRVSWVVLVVFYCQILSKGEKPLLLVGPLASVPPFPFPPIAAHYLPANGHVTECKGSSAPPPFKSVVGFLQSWWERRFGRRWVIDLCIPKIMRVLLDFETVEKMSRAENKLLKHVRCCCLFLRVFYSSFCFTLQVSC
ncbi:uncharacterized protein [Solanum tuberosum]|uniref:uncharacterized protein isoform X2 n=1 Tax=Solanum tuberosum TaxID=4113 RepID=UPI0003D27EBE|nr:PREDICTED: uncharacterized protein LOC102591629 isoform X2 [Solanum tuberosum]